MKTILRNSQKTHINIPKEIWSDILGWKMSQVVNIKAQNNKIIIEKYKGEVK
jgi:hypothetical protein